MRLYRDGNRSIFDLLWPWRTRVRRHADWQSRTGRIAGYSSDCSYAYVMWNGSRSLDPVSIDLIEPCSFAPDVADALVATAV